MGINNRYVFRIPEGQRKGLYRAQTQSVSGSFTGSQTDPSSYRGPAAGEMWELLGVRVYSSIALDTAILLTDEGGIEYQRLSMTNESPYTVPAGETLSWNSGNGSVYVLPGWRLYAKWYGDPVAAGSWNWQYTALVHQLADTPLTETVQYIP